MNTQNNAHRLVAVLNAVTAAKIANKPALGSHGGHPPLPTAQGSVILYSALAIISPFGPHSPVRQGLEKTHSPAIATSRSANRWLCR